MHRRFASSGEMTAPTQKVTWVIGACWGRDRVSDGDRVVVAADEHFADDEAQDSLLFFEVELVESVGEAAEEALEGVGEFEVGLGVVKLGVERVELGAECGLALAQRGHPGAQLVDRDQLFLVGLDQAGDGALSAGDVAFERFAASAGGVLGPQRLQPAVDLRAHQLGVFEQPSDRVPDESVELIGADRSALADAAADVAVVVRADAAVVVDPLVGRAGGAAVAAVAALAADEDALQQRRFLGVALGEVRVVGQAGLRELERLLGDDRRDRDQRPLLGGLVLAGGAAPVALAAGAGGACRLAVTLERLVFPNAACPR